MDPSDLFRGLDAFGDDRELQRLRKLHDGFQHGDGLAAINPVDEGLVDLDLVEREGRQIR